MGDAGFWDDQQRANAIATEVSQLKSSIKPLVDFKQRLEDLSAVDELLEMADGDEGAELEAEFVKTVSELASKLEALELQSFLSGKMDRNNAILSINAGAGGTESCDWAEMLLRMYSRWAERAGYTVEVDDIAPGEEAGISHATIRIMGENAYGYAKAERGVHRLVRFSPFEYY